MAILIALGANLAAKGFDSPLQACEAVIPALSLAGLRVVAKSAWYRSAPVPPSGQPDYVNGAVRVETDLAPNKTLVKLHEIEATFGRVRSERNAARTMDLDLLAYDDIVVNEPGSPILPHPRLAERLFVLLPLRDVSPDWRHPVTGRSVAAMIEALPDMGEVTRLG